MEDNEKDKNFKETQSTSSPGALGEDANRKKHQAYNSGIKENKKTSEEEGLNEEQSAGKAGAFEGLENTGDS